MNIGATQSTTRVMMMAKRWYETRSGTAEVDLESALIANQYMNDAEDLESILVVDHEGVDEPYVVCRFSSGIELHIPVQ